MDQRKYNEVFEQLESFILREMEAFDIPAVGFSLVKDNEIKWQKGFGWQNSEQTIQASSDTVFRVGSVSKLFTAVAIMQLHEQKKLDIDQPIIEICPELTFKSDKPITLRHLLSHRAGILRESPIGNYFDDMEPSIKETVLSILDNELIYEVGKKCKYSKLGPTIAGYILEKVTGTNFPLYVEQHIFKPLQMYSSSFLFDKPVIKNNLADAYMVNFGGDLFPAPLFQLGTIPAGNLYSTVTDLSKFMICLLNGGKFNGGKIIEQTTLNEMFTPQFRSCQNSAEFGLGFAIGKYGKYKRFWHNGIIYGFASDFFGLIEPQIGVIVTNNVDSAVGFNEKIKFKALNLLLNTLGYEDFPPEHKLIEPDTFSAKDYEGKYQSKEADAWVWLKNNDIIVQTMGVAKKISPVSKDKYITNDRLSYGMPVEFERNRENEITVMKSGNITYNKIKKYKADYSIPPEYEKFVGDYGNAYNILRIFVRDNRLFCLIEWFYEYPLTRVEDLIFAFPKYGLYDGEYIHFEEDEAGEIVAASAGFVRFEKLQEKVINE